MKTGHFYIPKRDLYMWKETYICEDARRWKQVTFAYQKATCIRVPKKKKRVIKCLMMENDTWSSYVKRDLCMRKQAFKCEKRPAHVKNNLHILKETFICENARWWKQVTFAYQKETCIRVPTSKKKGLFVCQTKSVRVWKNKYVTAVYRKETFTCSKRPVYVKRDLYMWKETCACEKRPKHVEKGEKIYVKETWTFGKKHFYLKKDLCAWEQTYVCGKRPTYVKSDLRMWKEIFACEKRPTCVKTDLHMCRETYTCEKKPSYVERERDCACEKRPTYLKRDLHMCKETYICGKRPTYVKTDL